MKRGFLLMNTGSPNATQEIALRRYLKEFLMDPHVIDMPKPIRAMLVNWIILPRRAAKSAKAYKKIWTENGSPLTQCCKEIKNALQDRSDVLIEVGMSYGNPSLKFAIRKLLNARVDELCVLPMFPQYAMATTGSCADAVRKEMKRRKDSTPVRVAPSFYNEPVYINPLAESLADADESEHLLFSYHGLPLRHLKKTDPTGCHCLSSKECCAEPSLAHDTCYRFQCLTTTRAIVKKAAIPSEQYSISFQSHLGCGKWLEPYTHDVLKRLPAEGKKKLAVICPSFFCDCLETLEEIEIRGKEIFLAAGGESFRMIPCLNDTPSALQCLETLMADAGNWPKI